MVEDSYGECWNTFVSHCRFSTGKDLIATNSVYYVTRVVLIQS